VSAIQIYISYSHQDDAVPPGQSDAAGFVTSLRQQLEFEFKRLGPEHPKFWVDDPGGLTAATLDPRVLGAIKASSIILVVLSPNWIASARCRQELAAFAGGGIVVVGKNHVDLDLRPVALRGQRGFLFYSVDDFDEKTGREREFFELGKAGDVRYFDIVEELASHLYELATAFEQGPSGSAQAGSLPTPSPGGMHPIRLDEVAAPAKIGSPLAELTGDPTTSADNPEYWLQRAEIGRGLSPGDQPLVLVSFASEDQAWLEELHAFLEPRIAELRDPSSGPYELWNFTALRSGTAPGDEFPEVVAEKMWRCRAAVIVLSKDYVRSRYCRKIELPFLLWRWEHHRLRCIPIRLGTVPIERVRIPAYLGKSRSVVLDHIIDDRQANIDFAASKHRDLNLKELKEAGLEAEIEKRFDGVGRRLVEFLKQAHGAIEDY
jgi:hypothetical protein